MRKHIVCKIDDGHYNVAWISLQPDGAISVGLSDHTYISPKFKARHFIWNAYNRIKIEYYIPSEPSALERVLNPHFTYHPPVNFHLRANKSDMLFQSIADVRLAIEQDGKMPWLRIISKPIKYLKHAGHRSDAFPKENIVIPGISQETSIRVEIDFIPPHSVGKADSPSQHSILWGDVAIQIRLSFTYPQIATLWWFHFY